MNILWREIYMVTKRIVLTLEDVYRQIYTFLSSFLALSVSWNFYTLPIDD